MEGTNGSSFLFRKTLKSSEEVPVGFEPGNFLTFAVRSNRAPLSFSVGRNVCRVKG